jgi:hypothetical protein
LADETNTTPDAPVTLESKLDGLIAEVALIVGALRAQGVISPIDMPDAVPDSDSE